MKLQNFVVIFIIIILPIVLILSFYISSSLKTVEFQTLYDNGLLNASQDALYALEMNTANDEFSGNPEEKRDILNASIKMYEKSLCNTCNIPSYNADEIEEYIPAIVFGMYDGFYMYAPSYNSVTRKYEHSLKNYVYYTETLEGLGKDGKDITVAYSLDNRITVTGDFGEGYEVKTGYLQTVNTEEFNGEERSGTKYNEINIKTETIDGESNNQANLYYSNAFVFSYWFLEDVGIEWPNYLKIGETINGVVNDPEDENSEFVKHKRKIIREKITGVLNSTITAYSQRTWGQHYKMPKLSEEDWNKVYSNISMISFLQGKDIGLTKYNGYTVVNSTNSREYVNSTLMYFIDEKGEYHDIRCSKCTSATTLTGYRIGNFERRKVEELDEDGETVISYKYDNEALACYECVNGSFSTNTSINEYIDPVRGAAEDKIKEAYWTSLGRERYDPAIKPVDIKIEIKFDINGGNSGIIDLEDYSQTYEYDGTGTTKIIFPEASEYSNEEEYYEYLRTKFTKTGYTFYGWSTTKSGITILDWDDITNSKPYIDVTYYAVWKPIDVNITFVWNYEDRSSNATLQYDEKIEGNMKIIVPTRTGYTFDGWSKDEGGLDKIDSNETVSLVTNTYYAQWTINDYKITFDYNRGLGVEDKKEVEVTYGTVVNEVLEEKPTRDGYEFGGWGTSSDSTVAITNSETVKENRIYYAIWKPIYTVTFVYNDGTGAELTKEFVEGDPVVFPTDMEDKREGFSFKGWNTDKDETTGITYAEVTGNTTYYAIWVRNEYTITLDPQNGEELQKITAPYDSEVDLPNDVIKIGYTLRGWSTNKEATEGEFTAIIPSNNVTTYYAVWEINKYNIVFDYNYDNKGTIRTDTDVEHGTLINFPEITRIGYTLKGWSKNAGAQIGTEEVVTSAEAIGTTMGEEIKYYAIWQINEYQVEFYKNDGTNDIYSSYKGIYNEAIEFPGTNPTRTGYTFLYWSNTQSGDAVAGNERVQATEVSGKENANKYYAIWEKNTYTVEFFKNDGTTSKHDEYTGYYNEAIKFPGTSTGNKPNPTRTGYTFLYWSNTATGGAVAGNEKIQATEVSGKANANKYYAIWEINKYTIKYNYNYDNKGIIRTDTNVVHGTNINFPSVTRTGYTFKGWNESSGATSGVTSLIATKDATYYAIWKDETPPVINSVTKSPGPGWTNKDVTVTVNATDTGSGIYQYSFDGGSTWQTSNTKTYSANTTNIRIVVKDKAGNKSTVWNEKIENIDKQKPTISAQYIDGQIKVVVNDTGGSGINWDSFKIGNKGNTGAGVKLTQSPQYIDAKYFISGYNGLLISDNAGNQVENPFDMTLDKESKLDSTVVSSIQVKLIDYQFVFIGFDDCTATMTCKIPDSELTRMYSKFYVVTENSKGLLGSYTERGRFIIKSNAEFEIKFVGGVFSAGNSNGYYNIWLFPMDENGNVISKVVQIKFVISILKTSVTFMGDDENVDLSKTEFKTCKPTILIRDREE